MLEPGVSEIGAVVGSYSAAHRVDNSVELPHVSCIAERKMNDCVRDEIWVTVPVTGTKGICSQCRALRVVFIDVPKSTLRTTSRLNAVLGQ